MLDVLIIGAGLTGLTAAVELRRRGWRTLVVDKGRGPGGRMSTRRIGELRFDHGAQYFTVRDAGFAQAVQDWCEQGLAGTWQPRLAVIDGEAIMAKTQSPERFVGIPRMSAICRALADSLGDCRFAWRASRLQRVAGGWRVYAGDPCEMVEARTVVLTAPAPQSAALLEASDLPVPPAVSQVVMDPCWAVLACFDRPLLAAYDAAFVNTGPLSWIAAQSTRPARAEADAWVLHASPAWSVANLELSDADATSLLLEAVRALPGVSVAVHPHTVTAHRWRFSIAREPLTSGVEELAAGSVVVAGDWACGSRVEGAWLSGRAAARRVDAWLA